MPPSPLSARRRKHGLSSRPTPCAPWQYEPLPSSAGDRQQAGHIEYTQKGLTCPFLLCCAVLLPKLTPPVLPLLAQVRVLLDLGLVETVDDGVLALNHVNALDLLVILEADLAHCHAAVLFQVGPWRVDDSNVVLLVACATASVCIILPHK